MTPYAKIRVVDASTGRGIPLVELRTVNGIRHVTDSRGLVAFHEPGLMDREVFFHLKSPGYEREADGFGYRGVALTPRAGQEARVEMTRVNLAERLCRLTGQGIYRDTLLLGEAAPIPNPVLNGGVMGQDTAQAEIYRGKMMWFWGDTDRTSFPLGNFHTTGAIATLPKGGADQGIEFRYFTKPDGFVRAMIESKESLPIWVSGMAVLGKGSNESLYAYYAQVRSLSEIASSGYLKWNDAAERFDIAQTFAKDRGWRFLDGHTVQHEGYILGNDPPNVRVRADAESLLKAEAYEAYTCLDEKGEVRRIDGKPDYRWQKSLPPISSTIEARLVREGKLRAEETHFLPLDTEGKAVEIHNGSVHWNASRKRWIGIFGRKGGKDSALGEIVYAEADAPTGPFLYAVKVCDHPKYTFYNPVHHAFLDKGSTIYFEGTYTAEFSGNEDKTPLYNYNQLLYKLDLNDPRLAHAKT
ncbi:hypothetical protein EON81_09075 [bacterium]|nr:MAG: hypothetical protein EON81_09075 [bacterium]